MWVKGKMDKINPNWIAGFVDGEGCFVMAGIHGKHGFYALPNFSISQTELKPLKTIRDYFGFGRIYSHTSKINDGYKRQKKWVYSVGSREKCLIIAKFFRKYKLQTMKKEAFKIWEEGIIWLNKNISKRRGGRIKLWDDDKIKYFKSHYTMINKRIIKSKKIKIDQKINDTYFNDNRMNNIKIVDCMNCGNKIRRFPQRAEFKHHFCNSTCMGIWMKENRDFKRNIKGQFINIIERNV